MLFNSPPLFFQISTGERTIDSPAFSERPKSSHSHYWYQSNSIQGEPRLHSGNSPNPNSGFDTNTAERANTQLPKFHSSFARCLNMPPMMMDQTTWLENELLETRQVSYRCCYFCYSGSVVYFYQIPGRQRTGIW